MQHYFEVNIRSLLLFFSASDRFQTLKDYLLQMGMEMAGLIAVELLIIVTGLSIVGFFYGNCVLTAGISVKRFWLQGI